MKRDFVEFGFYALALLGFAFVLFVCSLAF